MLLVPAEANECIASLETSVASKDVELSRASAEMVRLRTTAAELEGSLRKMRHEAAAGLASDELVAALDQLRTVNDGTWQPPTTSCTLCTTHCQAFDGAYDLPRTSTQCTRSLLQ